MTITVVHHGVGFFVGAPSHQFMIAGPPKLNPDAVETRTTALFMLAARFGVPSSRVRHSPIIRREVKQRRGPLSFTTFQVFKYR